MSDVVVSKSLWGRLYNGQTSFDFYGKRRRGFGLSLALIVISLVSLFTRGVNLGIDFEGGVAWQVPASATMDVDAARSVLDDNGVETSSAKIQTLASGTEEFIRIQVGDEPTEVRTTVQRQLAETAGVSVDEVSISSVSSSWVVPSPRRPCELSSSSWCWSRCTSRGVSNGVWPCRPFSP